MLLTHTPPQQSSLDRLYTERRLHFFGKGEEIPMGGQGIWQVYRGLVQLTTFHAGGEEVLLGWASPSTVFGMGLTNLPVYQAKTLSDVYVRWFSLSEIETSPRLAQMMWVQLNQRLRQSEALLAIAGVRRVEERLRSLFILLGKDIGQPVENGVRLPVRFTHQSLANAIGTTRVTVTRILGALIRQGEIVLDSDRHIILKIGT